MSFQADAAAARPGHSVVFPYFAAMQAELKPGIVRVALLAALVHHSRDPENTKPKPIADATLYSYVSSIVRTPAYKYLITSSHALSV